MRHIQSKVLPIDWLNTVLSFNYSSSTLSDNNKIIAQYLLKYIEEEQENSLYNPLVQSLIEYVIFKQNFLEGYDTIPPQIVEEGLKEFNGEKGFNFTRRLHSIFVEFIAYKDLKKLGYQYKSFKKVQGSCDLLLMKDNIDYNFEVKFKENEDIFQSRLFDYINISSLLAVNSFLRSKTFEIHIKVDSPNYTIQKDIIVEIKKFISEKNDVFVGRYINIFNANKRREVSRDVSAVSSYIGSLIITDELTEVASIEQVINNIFLQNGGHIKKIIDKSSKFENYKGYLSWSIPYHQKVDVKKIEIAFNNILNLDFDLYISVSGNGVEKENKFMVKASL